jgi:hypothetical protein
MPVPLFRNCAAPDGCRSGVPEPARGGCGYGVTGVDMRQKVGRDVLGAPLEVRGGSRGPALPEKREPHNASSYWGVPEPARGGCGWGVTGSAEPGGNRLRARAPRREILECAGLTALFLFPPKRADPSIQSGVKPPHSKGRHAPGGSPSWRVRGGSRGPALPEKREPYNTASYSGGAGKVASASSR